jgi:hypothetical protein
MLSAVSGSSYLPLLTRRALCGVLALALLCSPVVAQAQADQSTWFDPPPEGGVPDPYTAAPETEAAAEPEPEPAVADTDASALTTFRPALDPYGQWVNDTTYGTVWVPHANVVGTDFAPYVSRGRWALTADDDWIWVSDYPFGWAVFHYGRWVWISGHGWSWVPGRTYANAWVVWRVPSAGYAYVGWAPMPPSWVWMNGVAVGLWYAPPVPYVFCHTSFIFRHHVHYHIVRDRHLVHRIASNTRVYPTPYRAPARPTLRPNASTTARPLPAPASASPRGPRLSAARVPPSAVPAERAAPPASATRLSGMRRMTNSRAVPAQRAPAVQARSSHAAQQLPADTRRPVTTEPVRNTTPPRSSSPERSPRAADRMRSSPPERARSSSPRVRSFEPRAVAPVRSRPSFTPAPAPVRSRRRP